MDRLLLLACLLLLPATGRAADTMIVLDGSGSMWGRVDGRTKIEIAREALGGLVQSLPPGTRLGLMAYGHRRAGDCSDIETLIPAGALDAPRFAATANGVRPRGRTPISAALQQAATGGAQRIVLLSDGIETCVPDACADVRALRARGIDVTVHVIGFDISGAADRAALSCIAEATGGRYVPARNAADLGRALAELTGATAPAPAAAPPPPAPEPTPVQPAAVTETNLTLEATEVEGGPLVEVKWTVVALTEPPRVVFDRQTRQVQLNVAPGDYEARMGLGIARVTERFHVGGAQQTQRFVLGTGTVRASATIGSGQPLVSGAWTVLADEAPGYAAGEKVTETNLTRPSLRLPPGSYRLQFRSGVVEHAADVAVTAGETSEVVLDLNAGWLRPRTERGRPFPYWFVRKAGETRDFATSSSFAPHFLLPAGSYLLRMRIGQEWVERPVSIAAGQATEVSLARP